MRISKQGIDFIKSWEKFAATPYICQAGKLTIGYGHVIKPNEEESLRYLTEEQACALLDKDLDWAEDCVSKHIKSTLDQNQYDALVALVFNIGEPNFNTSTVKRVVNANPDNLPVIESAFMRWIKVRKKDKHGNSFLAVSRGLVNRRAAECKIYSRGKYVNN